jgi:hypothetical protein
MEDLAMQAQELGQTEYSLLKMAVTVLALMLMAVEELKVLGGHLVKQVQLTT